MAGGFQVVAFVKQCVILGMLVADVGNQRQPCADSGRIAAQMARGGLGFDGFSVGIRDARRPGDQRFGDFLLQLG